MVKKQQIDTIVKRSALDKFSLSFEYDKPIQTIKSELRSRTI